MNHDLLTNLTYTQLKEAFEKEELFEEIAEDWELPVCSVFACGKELTLVEQLCGTKCMRHMGEKSIDIMDCISF